MQVKKIKTARQDKGYTQEELAAKVGTKKQSISNWELGICVPTYSKLKKLSEVLDKDIDYLLSLTEEEPQPIPQIPEAVK